jgi:hypothetical protein
LYPANRIALLNTTSLCILWCPVYCILGWACSNIIEITGFGLSTLTRNQQKQSQIMKTRNAPPALPIPLL